MNTIETWTTFFGWMTIINIGVYVITLLALFAMRSWAYKINASLFGIGEDEVATATFNYIAAYKLLITVFCIAPWLALKLMA